MITIGQKIEEYFDYLGYTYDDLSSATDISTEQLLKVFKDEREVSEAELNAFAILFNTNIKELSNGVSLDEAAQVSVLPKGMAATDQTEINKFAHYLKNSNQK